MALALYIALTAGRAPTPMVIAVLAGQGGGAGLGRGDRTEARRGQFFRSGAPARAEAARLRVVGHRRRDAARARAAAATLGGTVTLRAAQIPPAGNVLAVSLEPPGGSPTGSPTGPVLYQGKVLIGEP